MPTYPVIHKKTKEKKNIVKNWFVILQDIITNDIEKVSFYWASPFIIAVQQVLPYLLDTLSWYCWFLMASFFILLRFNEGFS